MLKLGSLFDGSGGFPLAGMKHGFLPVWASEVEPFAVRVTTKRIPRMRHFGDVCRLDGAKLPKVDVITFGSPCQDMSMAGNRAGLEGDRSCLFYEAVRVIKEMRRATNGQKPRFCVWENVPGAFSSNGGNDFKTVLDSLVGIVEENAEVPPPEKVGWPNADVIMGDGWSIAWRTLNAEFFGVAQRRRRIFLVCDFGGERAAEILFEPKCVSGYSSQESEEREGTAKGTPGRSGTSGRICLNKWGTGRQYVSLDIAGTIATRTQYAPLICEEQAPDLFCLQADSQVPTWGRDVSPCLVARDYKSPPVVNVCDAGALCLNDQGGSSINVSKNVTGTLVSQMKGHTPLVFDNHPTDSRVSGPVKVSPTVCERWGTGGNNVPAVLCPRFNRFDVGEEVAPTMTRKECEAMMVLDGDARFVRRLTPLECGRLQGFPDWWLSDLGTPEPTEEELDFWDGVFEEYRRVVTKAKTRKTRGVIAKWLKDPYNDSAAYRLWGNGVALPCVEFVMEGIRSLVIAERIREDLNE